MPPVRPAFDVVLERHPEEVETRVLVGDRSLGWGVSAFGRLDDVVGRFARENADSFARLNAWPDVPHRDVIRCLDSLRRSGIRNVTFAGPPPGRTR